MGFFDRILRLGKSEAHAAVDKIEDPEKMSQQIVRELRDKMQEAINGTAQVKAIASTHRAGEKENQKLADEWEKKAGEILDRIEAGKLSEEEGNKLAEDCLKSQQSYQKKANAAKALADKADKNVAVLEARVNDMRDKITETENTAAEIRAAAKSAAASKAVNKTLSSTDTDGLMNTLSRMKEKVAADEFTAEAYASIDNANMTSEQKVNKILDSTASSDALEELKKKRQAGKS